MYEERITEEMEQLTDDVTETDIMWNKIGNKIAKFAEEHVKRI